MSADDLSRAVADFDIELLWECVYGLVSSELAIAPVNHAVDKEFDGKELKARLTQDVLLQLFLNDRLEHFASGNYTRQALEREIAGNELRKALHSKNLTG